MNLEKYQKVKLLNCVGGGSSAYGMWSEFMDYNKNQVSFIGIEAGGPKIQKHAAPLSNNSKLGVLHGAAQYVCQNKFGQIEETASVSAGLGLPWCFSLHCFKRCWTCYLYLLSLMSPLLVLIN